MRKKYISNVLCLLLAALLPTSALLAANPPTTRQWTVDGVTREARVCAPASPTTQPSPLVFAFHGHGGKMAGFARNLGIQDAWPEAIVVYPQGLNTPGKLTDKEGKFPGWQAAPGEQSDRDLKFFDAMLETIQKEYHVDSDRIYATGHSNGATFTYVLWAVRRERIAAFAPVASAYFHFTPALSDGGATAITSVYRPILHIAGENDPLVKFEWQQATIDIVRRINRCGPGERWGPGCTLYPSTFGAPVITYIHPGGHGMPNDAREVILKYFKQFAHPKIQPVER